MTRPSVRLPVAALLLGLVAAVLLPAAGASATAYRYWGFYQLDGHAWTYAQKGPAEITPADGTVEGWRFAVTDGKTPRTPRATATFSRLCGGTEPAAGKKRVGVVIDYGRAADSASGDKPPAPVGTCAQVPTSGTALDVLAAVVNVRTSKQLVCAIDGYPASGCGEAVKTVSSATKAKDGTVSLRLADTARPPAAGGVSTGTWVGIGVIVAAVLALGGVLLRRRRGVQEV